MRGSALVLALVLAGCVSLSPQWWPKEEHGGASGRPEIAPDWAFMAGGVALDGGLAAFRLPVVPRVLADVTVAVGVRTLKPLGRSEGSHFLILTGALGREIVGGFIRAVRHK